MGACQGRGVAADETAEDGAGHEAGAAGVVVVVEAADDLAGGVEAGDRPAGRVLDLGAGGDLEPAEGEGDAGGHRVGLVGRLVEALRPVGLVERKARRAQPVMDVRVERRLGSGRCVEGPHRLQKAARIDTFEPLGQGFEIVGLLLGDARDAGFLAQLVTF